MTEALTVEAPPAGSGPILDPDELEYRLLYAMTVAGKSAVFTTNAMHRFFSGRREDESPFDFVRRLDSSGSLLAALQAARTGNYNKLAKGFSEAARANFDLTLCTPETLQKIHGVGQKTARFFLLWTRPDAAVAALDTHILKFLAFLGYDTPIATPSSPATYAKLETAFMAEAAARHMTPRELDAIVWDHCSKGLHRFGWPSNLSTRLAPEATPSSSAHQLLTP
jgi:hypothetical protein